MTQFPVDAAIGRRDLGQWDGADKIPSNVSSPYQWVGGERGWMMVSSMCLTICRVVTRLNNFETVCIRSSKSRNMYFRTIEIEKCTNLSCIALFLLPIYNKTRQEIKN